MNNKIRFPENLFSIFKMILYIFAFSVFAVILMENIQNAGHRNEMQKKTVSDSYFRADFFSEEMWKDEEILSDQCRKYLKNVEKEASYYPIPESSVDKSLKTSFINSWMMERTYNGKRGHEGTDIMASENVRGLYPVVSISDGTVTNCGWLEKGGYRIGITSDSGTYYYYAHLDSYANIKEGDRVRAGEFIGYMGDSGYGPEGTKGKFDVHLHVGIYFYCEGEEISVNPYYLLRVLQNNKLKYAYS
ncbi:MAG: M23 family metallopeptidase [Lachnospiraceae bacterium]